MSPSPWPAIAAPWRVDGVAPLDVAAPADMAMATATTIATSTNGTRSVTTAVAPRRVGERVPSPRVVTSPIVSIVLAAGGGSRFEDATHKLRAGFGDATVVARSVGAAVASDVGPVLVVWGATELDDVLAEAVAAGVELVENPRWASGQATSLQAGVRRAAELGATVVVVGLGDQPGVPPVAWQMVASTGSAPIVTATFGGRRSPPVRLDEEVWSMLPVGGDEGARAVMRVRPDLVGEVACPGNPSDIDTVEDLRRWS
jgi:CTP:molybdopterin cytidylyltransferase MocA